MEWVFGPAQGALVWSLVVVRMAIKQSTTTPHIQFSMFQSEEKKHKHSDQGAIYCNLTLENKYTGIVNLEHWSINWTNRIRA